MAYTFVKLITGTNDSDVSIANKKGYLLQDGPSYVFYDPDTTFAIRCDDTGRQSQDPVANNHYLQADLTSFGNAGVDLSANPEVARGANAIDMTQLKFVKPIKGSGNVALNGKDGSLLQAGTKYVFYDPDTKHGIICDDTGKQDQDPEADSLYIDANGAPVKSGFAADLSTNPEVAKYLVFAKYKFDAEAKLAIFDGEVSEVKGHRGYVLHGGVDDFIFYDPSKGIAVKCDKDGKKLDAVTDIYLQEDGKFKSTKGSDVSKLLKADELKKGNEAVIWTNDFTQNENVVPKTAVDALKLNAAAVEGYVFKLKDPFKTPDEFKYVYLVSKDTKVGSVDVKKGDLLAMANDSTLANDAGKPKFAKIGFDITDDGTSPNGIFLAEAETDKSLKGIRDKALSLQEFKLEFELGVFAGGKPDRAELKVKIGSVAATDPKTGEGSELPESKKLYVRKDTTKLVDDNDNEYKFNADGSVSELDKTKGEICLLKDLKGIASKLFVSGSKDEVDNAIANPNKMVLPTELVFGNVSPDLTQPNNKMKLRIVQNDKDFEIEIDKDGKITNPSKPEDSKLVLTGAGAPKFENGASNVNISEFVDVSTGSAEEKTEKEAVKKLQEWIKGIGVLSEYLNPYELIVDKTPVDVSGKKRVKVTIKNKFEGPVSVFIGVPGAEVYTDGANDDRSKLSVEAKGTIKIENDSAKTSVLAFDTNADKLDNIIKAKIAVGALAKAFDKLFLDGEIDDDKTNGNIKKFKIGYSIYDSKEVNIDKYGRLKIADKYQKLDANTGVLSKADNAEQAANVRDLTIAGLILNSLGLNDKFEIEGTIAQDGENAKAIINLIDARGNKKPLVVTPGTTPGSLKYEVAGFKNNNGVFSGSTGNDFDASTPVMGGKNLGEAVGDAIEKLDEAAKTKLKKALKIDSPVEKSYKITEIALNGGDDVKEVKISMQEANDTNDKTEIKFYVKKGDKDKQYTAQNCTTPAKFKFDSTSKLITLDNSGDKNNILEFLTPGNYQELGGSLKSQFNALTEFTKPEPQKNIEIGEVKVCKPGIASVGLKIGGSIKSTVYVTYPDYKLFSALSGDKVDNSKGVAKLEVTGNDIKLTDGSALTLKNDSEPLKGLKQTLENGMFKPNFVKKLATGQDLKKLKAEKKRVKILVTPKVADKDFTAKDFWADTAGKVYESESGGAALKGKLSFNGSVVGFTGNDEIKVADWFQNGELKEFLEENAQVTVKWKLEAVGNDGRIAKLTGQIWRGTTQVNSSDAKVEFFVSKDKSEKAIVYKDQGLKVLAKEAKVNSSGDKFEYTGNNFDLESITSMLDSNSKSVLNNLKKPEETKDEVKFEILNNGASKEVKFGSPEQMKKFFFVKATLSGNTNRFFLVGEEDKKIYECQKDTGEDLDINKPLAEFKLSDDEKNIEVKAAEKADDAGAIVLTKGDAAANKIPEGLFNVLNGVEALKNIFTEPAQNNKVKFEVQNNKAVVKIRFKEKDKENKETEVEKEFYVIKATDKNNKEQILLVDKEAKKIYKGKSESSVYSIDGAALHSIADEDGLLKLELSDSNSKTELEIKDSNAQIPKELKEILGDLEKFEFLKSATPSHDKYEPTKSEAKLVVGKVEADKEVGEGNNKKKGTLVELLGTDRKLVATVFLPNDEDAVYDAEAKKKVKIDESAGKVIDGESKLSESAILMDVIVSEDIKNNKVVKEVSKSEVKQDAERKVKLEIEIGDKKQEVEIELEPINRNISSFKDNNNKDVYFDVFTFVKTDKDGKPLAGSAKISKEDIGLSCFRVGDVVYNISEPSPAETLDGILGYVLNKDDYQKIGKDNSIKEKVLRSLYTPEEAKKCDLEFKKFINKYGIFKDVAGKKVVDGEKAAKVFGEKFYMYRSNKYVCFPTAILTGVGSATFAALFFSGAVAFPFALPAAIAILSGTGAVSVTTGLSAVIDKLLANRHKKEFGVLVATKEKTSGVFDKIRKQPNKGKEKPEEPPAK